MDERISQVVKRAVDDAARYPFLFVGSGLSRRYMEAPNWPDLLANVCAEVFDDPFSFVEFKSIAKTAVRNGETEAELPYVATLMEGPVNHALFTVERFSGFRSRNSSALASGVSPLKLLIAEMISRYEMRASRETQKLARAGREK